MSTADQSVDETYKKIQKLSSSKFNYYFGYVVNFAIVFALLGVAVWMSPSPLTVTEWLYIPVSGYLFWTLLEYLLHRYTYHEWISAFSKGHGIHHDHPKDLMGVPWYINSTLFAAFYPVFVMGFGFHGGRVALFMAATWIGYILYCALHHGTHHWTYKWKWFQRVRKHHLIHHVHPETNMGISCTLWDYVFRTKKANTNSSALKEAEETHH